MCLRACSSCTGGKHVQCKLLHLSRHASAGSGCARAWQAQSVQGGCANAVAGLASAPRCGVASIACVMPIGFALCYKLNREIDRQRAPLAAPAFQSSFFLSTSFLCFQAEG